VAKLKAQIGKESADGAAKGSDTESEEETEQATKGAKKGAKKGVKKMSMMEEKRFKEAEERAKEGWKSIEPLEGVQKIMHVHSQKHFDSFTECNSQEGYCSQTLLFFFADSEKGCSKCVASKPALAAAAAEDAAWTVASIDCLQDDNHGVCARFITHKQKYPILVHMHGGAVVANISHGAELKSEELVAYVKSGGKIVQEEDAEKAKELAEDLDEL
jgi:hypothetical protein